MIKVTMGNNVKRSSEILDENTTLREALEIGEIDYTTGIMNLDGSTLSPGDLYKTFADFGIKEKCYLGHVEIHSEIICNHQATQKSLANTLARLRFLFSWQVLPSSGQTSPTMTHITPFCEDFPTPKVA